eukprot:972703-Ditylum_brightwellii.AAC.1
MIDADNLRPQCSTSNVLPVNAGIPAAADGIAIASETGNNNLSGHISRLTRSSSGHSSRLIRSCFQQMIGLESGASTLTTTNAPDCERNLSVNALLENDDNKIE